MNIIRPLGRKKEKAYSQVAVAGVPQTASQSLSSVFNDTKSFYAERRLYESLKNSVPVIDGAISKIVRLTGGFNVTCADKKYEKQLSEFLSAVNVGGNLVGIEAFTDLFLNQLLTYGTAVGEMVLNRDNRTFSLYNGELNDIVLERNKNDPMQIDICTAASGVPEPVKNNQTVLLSVLDPDAGKLHGNSLLKGLPFVSSVLMQIFQSVGANW